MFDINKPRQHITENTTPIALAIKQARVEAGMTQQALADFTGIGIKIIRNIEQGHSHVNLEKLKSILDFLGLELLVMPRDEAVLYYQHKQAKKQNEDKDA